MLELIVAHYQEDLNWLRRVPRNIRTIVYHKCERPQADLPIEIAAEFYLPNTGREAHTYLHHIVNHYDALADITIFAQGKPFDHVPDFHRILRRLAGGMEQIETFRWLGFMIDQDDRTGSRLFYNWGKNTEHEFLPMADFWHALWDEPVPETFTFYPSAHFVVTRETIHRQPQSFYEQALEISTTIPHAAHCFERCWDQVFDEDGIPRPYRDQAMPIYFRPVRRLGITWASATPPHNDQHS